MKYKIKTYIRNRNRKYDKEISLKETELNIILKDFFRLIIFIQKSTFRYLEMLKNSIRTVAFTRKGILKANSKSECRGAKKILINVCKALCAFFQRLGWVVS